MFFTIKDQIKRVIGKSFSELGLANLLNKMVHIEGLNMPQPKPTEKYFDQRNQEARGGGSRNNRGYNCGGRYNKRSQRKMIKATIR